MKLYVTILYYITLYYIVLYRIIVHIVLFIYYNIIELMQQTTIYTATLVLKIKCTNNRMELERDA